jgi:hypothetical protein
MAKWTRERIIRDILQRESAGLPLAHDGGQGVDSALYRAGLRIFGSWPNAILAAGIAPDRALAHGQWPPGKVLSVIRSLSRRRRPLRPGELKERYGYLVRAAQRCFGTWSKAVIAAGVDPLKLRRAAPWTRERIIESILMRALNNEALEIRTVEPKVLVAAGRKEFGTWGAALAAAGLDPQLYVSRKSDPYDIGDGDILDESKQRVLGGPERTKKECVAASLDNTSGTGVLAPAPVHKTGHRWSDQGVLQAIQTRLCEHRMMHSTAVYKDDIALYQAARRRHGNWSNALLAAGLNPDEFRK